MEHKMPPPPQKDVTITPLADRILEFTVPPVGFVTYLVLGEERAALIDTGMGVGSLKKYVEQAASLPVFVINTHGHPDHCGGNFEFEETWINPADNDVFEKMASLEFRREDISHMPGGAELAEKLQPTAPLPAPLADGQTFDLGGRTLRVIFAPGHTHGSLCVCDEKTGALFAGDNAMTKVSLHEWNSADLSVYRDTLRKLIDLKPTKVLGGHRPNENGPELLEKLLRCVERALSGEQGELRQMRGGVQSYVLEEDGVSFDYTRERLR
jgi:glyoxylase-like metal-dependent hydrolase (beta-lactamase superfamily II)